MDGICEPLLTAILSVAGPFAWAGLAAFMPMFTRLRPEAIVENPHRKRLLECLQERPGATLEVLADVSGTHRPNARYHLAVLERAKLVGFMRVNGCMRYFTLEHDPVQLRQKIVLEADRRVQELLRQIDQSWTPANRLVERLQKEWGISRSGSWKVIDRADHAQLIEKQRRRREVVIRIASRPKP